MTPDEITPEMIEAAAKRLKDYVGMDFLDREAREHVALEVLKAALGVET